MKDHASGQGPGLDAIFVLARTGAPIVAVGEQQQPAGVVAFGGDDETGIPIRSPNALPCSR